MNGNRPTSSDSAVRRALNKIAILVIFGLVMVLSLLYSRMAQGDMNIGSVSVTPTSNGIWVKAEYTGDEDSNNFLRIFWKISSNTAWPETPQYTLIHTASPFVQKIEGLTNGTSYDVRVEFVDNPVSGVNPRVFKGIVPSRINHNSDNATLKTMKWAGNGGWGIPGGKYDIIDCQTCHARSAPNIKRIKGTISASNGESFPGSEVTFNNTTEFGNDSTQRTSSNKICQICHSQTEYHRYDNTGQSIYTHYNNQDCAAQCHLHNNGFGHGGNGASCGTATECHGLKGSHPTHVNSSGGKGLSLACSECHNTSSFPLFKDGKDLAETMACNACHSPGGSYDGVNNAAIGAKMNWDAGVYESDNVTLKSGKERWCAGCHDESPSVIQGISAPNVIGDEDGAYTYGTGWGFYKTGHGLPFSSTYPASGGRVYGAGKECVSCHDLSLPHIDGNARTYSSAVKNYQAGYRLKSINGKKPMNIPRPPGIPLVPDDFRLCFSCHDQNRYLLQSATTTSFRDTGTGIPNSGYPRPNNAHWFHLDNAGNNRFDSDWDGATDSQFTCVNCHNVHGSTRLSMINDGKLVNAEPGLVLFYAKEGTTAYNPPWPPNEPAGVVTLDQSDGTIWGGASTLNICDACHGGNYGKYYRTPPAAPQAPVLSWTGEIGYETDGVEPNTSTGGSYFFFRIKYSDANSQIPRTIQVWVDVNDNGGYEENEKFNMQDASPSDIDCSDGKLYRKTIKVNRTGDGVLNYRFHASDGKFDATGDPTANSTLTVTNNTPQLAWTGEPGYEADGISPDGGLGGSSFTFRVKYTDQDSNTPTSIQVWIDENDNGTYEEGEKYSLNDVDAGDTTYSDGKLYMLTRAVAFAGDGTIHYRFSASDGAAAATGTATTDRTFAVTASNTAPVLSWTGETYYVLDGVHPDSDTPSSNFTFRVSYSDAQNNPPSVIEVWIDKNDNGIYEADEKYAMTAEDAGDTDYTNGKLYSKTMSIAGAGDGIIDYRFYASDASLEASGTPTADSFLTMLVNAKTISCSGGKDYTTIQAAVNAASSGDTLLVSDCTYTEKVTIDGKSITIKSVNGATGAIIDGGGSGGSVVKFQNGANGTLNGFTVRNGAGGGAGGGIYISNSSPTITNSIVANNDADNGAGIYLTSTGSATVTISNSTVSNNVTSSLEGGALYLASGCSAIISGSTFSSNQGRYSGGVYLTTSANASLSISDSQFTGNRGTLAGGAIYVTASGGTLPITIADTTFTNNDANDNGGAIFVNAAGASATLTISGSTFTGNNTAAQGSALDGGAIYLGTVSSTSISNSIFSNNTGRSGGALYVTNSGANSLTISDSVINSNSASALQGGGLYISGGAAGTYTAVVERTTVAGNQADDNGGGGFLTGAVAATFTNCMITGNKALTLDGGGLHITGATIAPVIMNSTISGNYAEDQGGGIYNLGGSAFSLTNSILWNNRDYKDYPDIAGPTNASYSDIWQPGFTGTGLISSDPLFVNEVDSSLAPTTTGNYHLLMDSPAMDAGTSTGAPSEDIDGDVRPSGAAHDMGADEVINIVNNAPLLSWTGEAGYASDGVSPDVGAGGANYEFRVNYSDIDNHAPSTIQIWVDANDNGIYEPGEKYAMTAVDGGDTTYTDGKLYTKTLSISYAGDGYLRYRFNAADGYEKTIGEPTQDKYVVINDAPTLSWIGSGNFTADGIHPDSATSGTSFEFRIRFTDANNNPPTSLQVWVDKNDNASYEADEKFTMVAVDSGDTTYTDGKDYTRTIALTKAGDGILNYRFYASDGSVASGAPTANSTVTVTNNFPALAWTGETNYTTDGVDPNSAIAGSSFTFRVSYTDADNEAPTVKELWVDADNSGVYDPGEKYTMDAVDVGDTTYTDGKLYTKTLTLSTSGSINYKFVFNDGTDAATGSPAEDSTVSVTGSNTPPDLAWTGETSYSTDGVNPDSYAGGTNFTFRVKYTDAENTAPASIQVWVDKNDNSSYESGEKYDMTAVDTGDSTYTDGKLYFATVNIPYAGDGVMNYRFYAHDGTDPATGAATADKTVTVANPKIVPSVAYPTITAAISAASNGDYILVSDSASPYSENINYADKSITIVSVNGPAVTKIQGTGANSSVVTFGTTATASSGVLDGFTIDNQAEASTASRGISIGSNDSPTIRNCIIEGNSISSGQFGAGININGGTATIENTTFGSSGKPNSSAGSGGALYATALSAPLSISNSTFAYNTASSAGGAVYLSNTGQTTTFTNSVFDHNTVTNYGGAINATSSPVTITGGSMTYNSCTSPLDGGAIYLTGATSTLNVGGTAITNNSARNGAAIYTNSGGTPAMTISNATITNNTASGAGGAMYLNSLSGTSAISNTSISSNGSTSHGGGIYSTGTSFILTNCTLNNNSTSTASVDGGAIYAITGGTVTLNSSTISGNSSRNGAGVYAGAGTTLSVDGSTINSNIGNTTSNGGGIYSAGTSLSVSKTNIKGNRGGYDGGGIFTNSTTATITNSIIAGNITDQQTTNSDGGGIYVAGGTVNIYNSTVAGNYASGAFSGGGGGLRVNAGTVTVINSIIWGNTAGSNAQVSGAPATTYTDIQGGCASCIDRTGNIDLNPQFISLQQASSGSPTAAGNYHLCYAYGVPDAACTTLSPCIDTASETNAPADDIEVQIRPFDVPGVGDGVNDYDMGADEYVP